MLDALRGYIQMASGLTEVTTAKAKEIAVALVSHGINLGSKAPDVVGQVQDVADDLVATGRSNRDLMTGMVRTEVDKAVGRMGVVREDELAALRRHVQRLEEQLHAYINGSVPAASNVNADPHPQDEVHEAVESQNATVTESAVHTVKKKVYLDEAGNPIDAR